jgi:hypothetical protein
METVMHTTSTKLRAALTTAVFAALAASAAAQVSTTANGPYYATPSWDQKITTNRFVILANWNAEAVLDRETGLVWEKAPVIPVVSWYQAVGNCAGRTIGSRMGWRLPTVQELGSLVDETVLAPGPRLPAGHPFQQVQQTLYWTSSSNPANSTEAFVLAFNTALVFPNIAKTQGHNFWCVRGGQGSTTE